MRLITRSDFDGLACGSILEALGVIDEWLFVHPKDIQDGRVKADENDIVANVPFIEGCGLWFDHHSSEEERLGKDFKFNGVSRPAASCARIVYEYYDGGEKLPHMAEMVDYVDRVDSADLSRDEIMKPSGWVLLGFLVDPRTGLGRIHSFTKSNMDLMVELSKAVPAMPIDEILEMEDVRERIDVYFEQQQYFIEMIEKHSWVEGNAVYVDLREMETIFVGNRFILYTLFPDRNISVWVVSGKNGNTAITVGHSVVDRTSSVDVGSLMLKYGGGGHRSVGTCQVDNEDGERVIREIIDAVK